MSQHRLIYTFTDHLSMVSDEAAHETTLLNQKLFAAEAHVQRLLGCTLAERFEGDIPPDVDEAIMELAAHWYENREAAGERMYELPFGVREILNGYREFTF